MPHLRRDSARPATSAPGLGLTPATSRTGTGLHPCYICAGTGLTPATSAPGLGLTRATSAPGLGLNPRTRASRFDEARTKLFEALKARARRAARCSTATPRAQVSIHPSGGRIPRQVRASELTNEDILGRNDDEAAMSCRDLWDPTILG